MVKQLSVLRLSIVIGVSSVALVSLIGCSHSDDTPPSTPSSTPPTGAGTKAQPSTNAPTMTKPQSLPRPPGVPAGSGN
jgi:hypothetical protein